MSKGWMTSSFICQNLGARLQNFSDQVCQLAIVVNARKREKFVDDEDDEIESTPTYEESIQIEHERGRNGKEDDFNSLDDIFTLPYPQHATQLFESKSNQALETFKKLSFNSFFCRI